jgi:hypothetical protein
MKLWIHRHTFPKNEDVTRNYGTVTHIHID